MTGVRAVLFDVFGTLVDYRTSIARDLERFGRDRGIACDWHAFVDAWRGSYAPAMDRVRRGESPWQPLDALHATSLDELWQRFELPPFSAQERTWLVRRWHELEPWPDVVAGLHALRGHAIVGSLSNGNVALQVDLAKHAKLPFDVLFSAEHFRHYKPDAQTYLGAVDFLALRPEDVALAAAHNGDLRAAASHGLRTIFLPRPTEHGSAQTTDLIAEGSYDLVVRDVGGIATAFAGEPNA